MTHMDDDEWKVLRKFISNHDNETKAKCLWRKTYFHGQHTSSNIFDILHYKVIVNSRKQQLCVEAPWEITTLICPLYITNEIDDRILGVLVKPNIFGAKFIVTEGSCSTLISLQ